MMPPPPCPPHRPLSSAQARALDAEATAEFGLPSLVLMEHAGREVARLALGLARQEGPVAVLCGPGNNGGDGYACARFLASWGVAVRAVRCAPSAPRGPDAALEHALAAREGLVTVAQGPEDAHVVAAALEGAGVIVDALFGLGLTRPLEAPYPRWIELANASGAPRLAVDVPSGLDADTGLLRPIAIRADLTATIVAPKWGFLREAGPEHVGRVVEVDIGLPRALHARHLA